MKGTWPLMAPAQLMGVWIKKSVIKGEEHPRPGWEVTAWSSVLPSK